VLIAALIVANMCAYDWRGIQAGRLKSELNRLWCHVPSRALKRRQNSWSSSSSLGCLGRSCGCLTALLYSSCFETSPILSRNVSSPSRFSTSCRSLSCVQLSHNNFRPVSPDAFVDATLDSSVQRPCLLNCLNILLKLKLNSMV
jgi:hypothetical protein